MSFASPMFLWALTAIAAPVIIHLFNFRRYKKVYFTNVRFLREIQEESKSSSRLREILILLMRCLTIACLVIAFAQPFIPSETPGVRAGSTAVSIYIDNSFSMQNVNRQGPLLDVARLRAKEIVKAFGGNNRFQVITNDFEGRHQRLFTAEDVLAVIDEIKPSPAVRLISEVVRRQQAFLAAASQPNKSIYLLTDLQRSTFDHAALPADTAIALNVVPVLSAAVSNVFADSCWFSSPVQQKGFIQELHARIRNKGDAPLESGTAKLTLNDRQVALTSFSIGAGGETEVKFVFECKTEGFNFGSVRIEDYPITFDDELWFSFNSRISIPVTLVTGAAQKDDHFRRIFGNDSLFALQSFTEKNIDFRAFKTADVLVLDQIGEAGSGFLAELRKFCEKGGEVIIVPSPLNDASAARAILSTAGLPPIAGMDTTRLRTDRIDVSTGFFEGVFEKTDDRMNTPVVLSHYKLLRSTQSDVSKLLRLENGDPLLISGKTGNGRVYFFTTPLTDAYTNLPRHALFVPVAYRIAFNSLRALPLYYNAGENVMIEMRPDASAAENPPHIRQINGTADIIPERRLSGASSMLYTRGQVTEPGYYTLQSDTMKLRPLAFNFSRRESDLSSFTAEEFSALISEKHLRNIRVLSDQGGGISEAVITGAEGRRLWKLFIFLALAFIATEVALLRILK